MPAAMQKVAIGDPEERWLPEERHVEHGPVLTHLDQRRTGRAAAPHRRARSRITVLVQPLALPRRIPKTIKNSAAANVTRPRTSVWCAPSSRDSGDTGERDRECEHPDRDVDEEDPAPPEAVGEDATDEGTAGNGGAYRGAPDRKRSEAVRPAVLVTDQSQRRCEQRGAADPLERTCHVETRDAPGDDRRGARTDVKSKTPAMKTRRRPYLSASAPAVRINAARLRA